MNELSPKQARFCEEYVIDFNGAKAAERAGYSKKTARTQASDLLTKPDIQAYVEELREKLRDKSELSAQLVLDELRSLAFYSIKDFVLVDNEIQDLSTMSRKTLRPVTGIKTTKRYDEAGNLVTTTELKMVDKRAALVDLGKHLGIFKEDNSQKVMKIKVTRK